MKKKVFSTIILAGILSGCAATSPTTSDNAPPMAPEDSRLTNCSLPTVDDRGPIRPSLYVIGTFPRGEWLHTDNHKMSHKGDGIYQVVSEEKAGNVSLQFATMSWNPQFTVSGLKLPAGTVKELKRGGFAKDTVATLPEDGTYVWTAQFSDDKKPIKASVVKCE